MLATDELSSAIDAGMVFLTPQERRLFDCLLPMNKWVDTTVVQNRLYGDTTPAERHAVRVHLYRLRRKLDDEHSPYLIEGRQKALRIVLRPDAA